MAPFAALLSLALSAPILLTLGNVIETCDTSHITLPPLPSPLTPPPSTSKLSYVAVGFGTQNYTCGSTGTYTNIGAVAELFDISCFARNTTLFDAIPRVIIDAWNNVPGNLTQDVIATLQMSKHPQSFADHYFVPNGTAVAAKWDATLQTRNPNAFVIASKLDQAGAPTGNQDIAWVSLRGTAGQLAKQVYRTNTQLGQPPANCTPGSPEIEVKYAAIYYFFDSTLE